MKSIKKDVVGLINMRAGLWSLLQQSGILRKKVYWIDRDIQILDAVIKRWMRIANSIRDKYVELIPRWGFVPPIKYLEFKKEVFKEGVTKEEREIILKKYEVLAPPDLEVGVPFEKVKSFEEELEKAKDEFFEIVGEIEIYSVELDRDLEEALKRLIGKEILAIKEIFVEEGGVVTDF